MLRRRESREVTQVTDLPEHHGDFGDFDDPAHTEVRALLAEAREFTPIPQDVAARLDATLSDLQRSSLKQNPSLQRRLAPRLLAAAVILAAAGVGAIGISRTLGDQGGSDPSAATGASVQSSPGRNETPSANQDARKNPTNQFQSARRVGLRQQLPQVHLRRRRDPLRAATCRRGSHGRTQGARSALGNRSDVRRADLRRSEPGERADLPHRTRWVPCCAGDRAAAQ